MDYKIEPIGVIHSPFKKTLETPIQPFKSNAEGKVKVFNEYAEGLKDIEGFSHIILLYVFHKSRNYKLTVKPFLDKQSRGLFATRAPWRPNPIGLSIVELLRRKKNVLAVKEIDVLDETPLIDIKPYVPTFDERQNARIGWLQEKLQDEVN